jgi:hypothetical protein
MAWVAEENFNSYSDGDLNTLNGGSGFSGAWSGGVSYDVQGTVVLEGAKAVVNSGNANADIQRDLTTATNTGVVYFGIRRNDTGTTGQYQIQFRNSVSGVVFKVVMDAGKIDLVGASTQTLVATYLADTWYGIRITYSDTAGTPSVVGATNSGTGWSADSADVDVFAAGEINRILVSIDALGAGVSAYLDSISASDPVPSTDTFIPQIIIS